MSFYHRLMKLFNDGQVTVFNLTYVKNALNADVMSMFSISFKPNTSNHGLL